MLVLSHADGLWINLHQLRQGVLEAAGNGGGASLSHVKIGKFLCGKFAGRVYGSPGLIDNHILHGAVQLFQQLHNDLLGFPGRRALTHGNQIHMIFGNQALKFRLGLRHFVLGGRGINHLGIQHLSGGIHHRQLTAGAKSRVPAQYHFPRDGRLQQQLFQVLSKHGDSAVLGSLREIIADLPLYGGSDQPLVGILTHGSENRCGHRIILPDQLFLQITQDTLCGSAQLHGQHLLRLSPVQRQHPVPRDLFHGLFKMIIHLIYGLSLLVLGLAADDPLIHGSLADIAAVIRLIGYLLRQNVHGPLYRFLNAGHLLGDIFFRLLFQRCADLLGQDYPGQGLQSPLSGDAGPGLSLGAVRSVQILHRHQGQGFLNLRSQLFRQFSLFLYAAKHLLLFLLQTAKILQTLVKVPQLLVIQRAGDLLPVTGYKGNGIALVNQLDGGLHLPFFHL